MNNHQAQRHTSRLKYSRARRLSRASEIELVRRTGKRMRTGHLEARVTASPSSHATGEPDGEPFRSANDAATDGESDIRPTIGRVGIIVPKYGHQIVERNRLRRRLRELVRTRLLPTMPPRDVLVRALPHAYGASFDALARDIDVLGARLA